MRQLANALVRSGIVEIPAPVMHGPRKPPVHLLSANAKWHRQNRHNRPTAHFADLAKVMRSHMRNPSTTGTMPNHVRAVDAAGSDTGRAYKLSGPAVRFGWTGRSKGQQHADQRHDYWLPTKVGRL